MAESKESGSFLEIHKLLLIADSEYKLLLEKIISTHSENLSHKELEALIQSCNNQSKYLNNKITDYIQEMESLVLEYEHLNSSIEYKQILRMCIDEFQSLQKRVREAFMKSHRILVTNERETLLSNRKVQKTVASDSKGEDAALKSLQLNQNIRDCVGRMASLMSQSQENSRSAFESSEKILDNQSQLRDMKSNLKVSNRLRIKFSRRQVTDLIIYFLTFSFFYLTCAYIIINRLYR